MKSLRANGVCGKGVLCPRRKLRGAGRPVSGRVPAAVLAFDWYCSVWGTQQDGRESANNLRNPFRSFCSGNELGPWRGTGFAWVSQ